MTCCPRRLILLLGFLALHVHASKLSGSGLGDALSGNTPPSSPSLDRSHSPQQNSPSSPVVPVHHVQSEELEQKEQTLITPTIPSRQDDAVSHSPMVHPQDRSSFAQSPIISQQTQSQTNSPRLTHVFILFCSCFLTVISYARVTMMNQSNKQISPGVLVFPFLSWIYPLSRKNSPRLCQPSWQNHWPPQSLRLRHQAQARSYPRCPYGSHPYLIFHCFPRLLLLLLLRYPHIIPCPALLIRLSLHHHCCLSNSYSNIPLKGKSSSPAPLVQNRWIAIIIFWKHCFKIPRLFQPHPSQVWIMSRPFNNFNPGSKLH